jgi:hypothetical protein
VLGVSKGAFYRWFASKGAPIAALAERTPEKHSPAVCSTNHYDALNTASAAS